MFYAETLALRVGGAARHGARLSTSTAVFEAMQRSGFCVGGASFKLARSTRAVLGADTAWKRKGGATFLLAHFLPATAVLAAPASGVDGSSAVVEQADLFGAMFTAKPSSCSNVAAAFRRARHRLDVVFQALPSHRGGMGDARVRGAVSIGAVLDADKLAKDLRGVAVWIGARQLHCVFEAHPTFLPRGGGATFAKTLA